MGCGFKADNGDLIVQFLANDFFDFSLSKENDFCPWILDSNVNNVAILSSRISNQKNNPKPSNFRTYGYKSNNKVNNYTFRHYKSNDNYIIQYRNENKSHRCLSYNAEAYDIPSGHLDVPYELPVSTIMSQKVCPDPQEKPLIHQVRFWQNQNPLIQPVADVNTINEGPRTSNSIQIINPVSRSINTNAFAQRSCFNTKRNLDMIIPQGTTYDILSDDNRINSKDDPEKLTVKVSDDNPGLVSVPYAYLRESTKMKKLTKDGGSGSLEFARLLDEKLRQLYEQKSLYQPIIEINRLKPENRHMKPITRMKSASQVKDRSTALMKSNSLHSLAVNGQSAQSRFGMISHKLPSCTESQCFCCTPCLLPQMPAFGMHNFPRFIVFPKCTNAEHDE